MRDTVPASTSFSRVRRGAMLAMTLPSEVFHAVTLAPETGHDRYASLVPSAELMNPLLATSAPSGAKVSEPTQNLERLLLGFEQRRRVRADAAQRVSPLRAGRALGMEAKCRWIKEDPLAFDLLDHRPLGQDVFERLTAG